MYLCTYNGIGKKGFPNIVGSRKIVLNISEEELENSTSETIMACESFILEQVRKEFPEDESTLHLKPESIQLLTISKILWEKPEEETRVFYYRDSPCSIKVAWPQVLDNEESEWIIGEEAETIYKNADFICVSVDADNRNFWDVHSVNQDQEERFEIDYPRNQDERYSNLVTELENRSKTKSLTILIC